MISMWRCIPQALHFIFHHVLSCSTSSSKKLRQNVAPNMHTLLIATVGVTNRQHLKQIKLLKDSKIIFKGHYSSKDKPIFNRDSTNHFSRSFRFDFSLVTNFQCSTHHSFLIRAALQAFTNKKGFKITRQAASISVQCYTSLCTASLAISSAIPVKSSLDLQREADFERTEDKTGGFLFDFWFYSQSNS